MTDQLIPADVDMLEYEELSAITKNGVIEDEIETTVIDCDCGRNNNKKKNTSNAWFAKKILKHLSCKDRRLFELYGRGPLVPLPYTCIHHAFESRVIEQPDAIAAQHLGESISYRKLNQQANALAALLVHHGVKTGDNVGLFVQRSIPMLVGILGALKAGASYVPQHIGVAPYKQLQHVIKTASTKVILTLSESKHLVPLPKGHTCIAIDDFAPDANDLLLSGKEKNFNDFKPNTLIRDSNGCFIIFTSGTTGKPNGVQVTHRNACNILLTEPGRLGMQPGVKVSQILNIAFDMAAWEILGCLAHGATLNIRGKDLESTVRDSDIVISTPSILGSLDHEKCRGVKVVAVAGEPCPKAIADNWSAFCQFYNSCGPTETTIVNTVQRYLPEYGKLTIGVPTPNNTVYILNGNMKPCAIGEVGEMWAGGACVSAGYLQNTPLNSQRYVDDPFLGGGRKMFRTRDLGRWTKQGELEHLGRVDDQVKVRGFRVELDSVSSVLESLPPCRQAVTLKLNHCTLVAFVTPSSIDAETARQQVASSLPYYCVPSFIVPLENLPMTSRGKVDKRELLRRAVGYYAPQSNKEKPVEVSL